ncbi:MAG: LAGLIDADG family homing endonuclease, partial [Sphaerospermopsis kisseleviana]
YKGFIRGLFDADGSVQGSQFKGVSVRLCQSNLSNLKSVQRMLLRIGINSVIYKNRRDEGQRLLPDSKRENKLYNCQSVHELVVANDNVAVFRDLIGFNEPAKRDKLDLLISQYVRKPNKDRFVVTVESLDFVGIEDVYDCTVPAVSRFDANGLVVHNCAEASLDDRQSCNLTTGNVKSCVYWDEETHTYMFDWEKWFKVICLVTRLGCRITLASQWHPEWDKIQKRDRLLGVSMTGVMDAFDLLGWDDQQQKCFFSSTKSMAIITADEYHNFLGINRSARVCLMKPEGTISLLPTVSSGIHRAYAPYYLRRVRFSKFDPLAKVLLDLGLRPVPENGQGDDLFGEKCTTWVFTFPIKSNAKIRAIDETVVDQLERYKLAQTYYADRGHNISCTITVARHEYDTAAKWVNDNWDSIIGVAFLPRFDPMEGSKASYPLMPLEPCDQETYEKLKAALPTFSQLKIIQKLSEIEKGFEEQELEKGCFTGACPVR